MAESWRRIYVGVDYTHPTRSYLYCYVLGPGVKAGTVKWQVPVAIACGPYRNERTQELIVGTNTGQVVAIGGDGTIRTEVKVGSTSHKQMFSHEKVLLSVLVPPGSETDSGGTVVALDPATYDKLWSRPLHQSLLLSTAETDGVLFYSELGGEPVAGLALDPASGEVRWQTDWVSGITYVGAQSGRFYVSTPAGMIMAYQARTGQVLWSTQMHPSPVVGDWVLAVGDTVFVATNDGAVHAFATADGSWRWTNEQANVTSDEIRYSGQPQNPDESSIVFGTTSGVQNAIRALDASTGSERWTTVVPGELTEGAVIFAGGTRFFGHGTFGSWLDGVFHFVDVASGELTFQLDFPGAELAGFQERIV